MGKRSPHEATCPRIASVFHEGRTMSAVFSASPERTYLSVGSVGDDCAGNRCLASLCQRLVAIDRASSRSTSLGAPSLIWREDRHDLRHKAAVLRPPAHPRHVGTNDRQPL